MLIFPAIDILGGRVVRLFQGDYANKEVYGDEPAAFAQSFYEQGASWLHLVDLDGAKAGSPQNLDAVQRVMQRVKGLSCELGGGIRSEEAALRCFEAGVKRAILGTAALRRPEFVRRMLRSYGEGVAVGVDARSGKVAVEGWLSQSDEDGIEFCRRMQNEGVKYIIYTDISRDGAQRGPNLAVYESLAKLPGLCVTASGGVSSLADVAALRDLGLYGAIVGKALYTGAVNLREAIEAARS